MNVLADLILADSDDVADIVASEYPLGTFKGINVDGLDPPKVAALHALLSGKNYEELLSQYRPIARASPNGPWLVQLPRELIERMAGLAPHEHVPTALEWLRTDPLIGANWSEHDAGSMVSQVGYLAQTAKFEEKEIFLWVYS
jgi:hypothetical protein